MKISAGFPERGNSVPDSLLKAYREAQMYANTVARPAKELKESAKKLISEADDIKKKIAAFEKMLGVIEWAQKNAINTKNFIFYDHSQTVCIGWQRALSKNEVEAYRELFSKTGMPHESIIEFKTIEK